MGSTYIRWPSPGGSSGSATWGDITGTLSNQTDLQTALNAKLSLSGGTMTGALAMGSHAITGLSDGVNPNDAVTMEQLAMYAPLSAPDFNSDITFNGTYHLEPATAPVYATTSTTTIDLSTSAAFLVTLSSSTTLSFTHPSGGGTYVFEFKTGTGGFAVTWPSGVLWPMGIAPIITVSASATDLVSLYYDGTNYLGTYAQAFA